jgi:hypothetical protein
MKKLDSLVFRWILGGSMVLLPTTVIAQVDPAAPAATAPAPTAPATAPAPTVVEPVVTAPTETATVEPAPPPPEPMEEPVVAEVAPDAAAAEEEAPAPAFTVTTGVGFRVGFRAQDPEDPEKLGDLGVDELNVEPRFSGRVTDVVGWTANLTISGRTIDSVALTGSPGPIAFEARAMDLVGQLDFHDWFHVWMGRMLTPSDRSNFSGAWFMSPWNYPGVFFTGPVGYVGPRGTEEIGREVGTVVWGHDPDGKFKYYLGVLDLDANAGNSNAAAISPLYAARVGYAIIGSEKGFYGSSTYYGGQDVLALGAAFRTQAALLEDDPATPMVDESDDSGTTEYNVDLLAEFNPAGVGMLSGELAYYGFDSDVMPMDNMIMAVLSYATPEPIGIGKLGPVVRFQTASNSDTDVTQTQFDAGIQYLMKDYFAKLQLTYTMAMADGVLVDPEDPSAGTTDSKANLLQLGFQIQQ